MVLLFKLSKLKTNYIGQNAFFYSSISSTNDIAKTLSKNSANGTIFLSKSQTNGRGKGTRKWISPEGGIYLSILLKEKKLSLKILQQIPLLTALSICETLKAFNINTYIKWPNDIILNNKKLGGILCESKLKDNYIEYIIIGVGLNVNSIIYNNKELNNIFTSLKSEFNKNFDIEKILSSLLNNFEQLWEQLLKEGFNNNLLNLYKKYSLILNKKVKLSNYNYEETVHIVDILNSGELICKTNNGLIKKVVSGDISIRGLTGYI